MLDNCCAFTGHRPYKFPWRYNDSIMTLAVAGAIMSTEEKDHKLESAAVWYMQELGRRYFNCVYGGQFRQ